MGRSLFWEDQKGGSELGGQRGIIGRKTNEMTTVRLRARVGAVCTESIEGPCLRDQRRK